MQTPISIGYQPVPLSGDGKVVDIATQRTAEALVERDADVMLVSHDGDFAPQMQRLAKDGAPRVGVLGFGECLAGGLRDVPGMESSVSSTTRPPSPRLPLVRVVPIDEFDPLQFI